MGERYFGKRQLDCCSFAFEASGELLINHALQHGGVKDETIVYTCRMCQAFYIVLQNYSSIIIVAFNFLFAIISTNL